MTAAPQLTIVVTPREQFGIAERSLESILEHTSVPHRLIYVDGNSPPPVADYLRGRARERGFMLLRSDSYLTPNHARNWAFSHVDTGYVMFVDNDVVVTPGWVEPLLRRMEEDDAWAVGPLYFEGQPEEQIIHMAGGVYEWEGEAPRRAFHTGHLLQKTRLPDLDQPLTAGPCSFVEFHCMLVRREVLARLGPLDEELMNTREHLDLCLAIESEGGTVWFEPESVVSYITPPPLRPFDREYFALRWSEGWTLRSLRRFRRKHGIAPEYEKRAVVSAARRLVAYPLVTRFASWFGAWGERRLLGLFMMFERFGNRLRHREKAGSRT